MLTQIDQKTVLVLTKIDHLEQPYPVLGPYLSKIDEWAFG